MPFAFAALIALAAGMGPSFVDRAPGPAAPDRFFQVGPDHAPLDRILAGAVRDERVDYLLIRKRHREELARYLDALAAADDAALPGPERLALYLNAYNATMIDAVVRRLRADWDPSAGDFAVFKEDLVRLRGRTCSLNVLENDLIRRAFAEPRIHVALVCGARSCPPLSPRAWRAEDLDRELERAMARFVNDRTRNAVDLEARTVRLSRIFEWYAADFGGPTAVLAYADRYHEADLAGFALAYLDYDWSLNVAPPREGRWVKLVRAAPLHRDAGGGEEVGRAEAGEILEATGEAPGRLRIDRPFGGGAAWVATDAVLPYAP